MNSTHKPSLHEELKSIPLPHNLVNRIFDCLPIESCVQASRACRLFKNTAENPEYWLKKMDQELKFYPQMKDVFKLNNREYCSPSVVYYRLHRVKAFIENKTANTTDRNEAQSILTVAANNDYAPVYRKFLNAAEEKEIAAQPARLLSYLRHAIFFNNLELIDWILTHKKNILTRTEVIKDCAFVTGNLAILDLLKSHNIRSLPHVGLLKFTPPALLQKIIDANLIDLNGLDSDTYVQTLISIGNVTLLKKLFGEMKLAPHEGHMLAAFASGNLECVNYLVDKFCFQVLNPGMFAEYRVMACSTGNESLVNFHFIAGYFAENPNRLSLNDKMKMVDAAALSGNEVLVKNLLQSLKISPTINTLENAAAAGSLSLFKYLMSEHKLNLDAKRLDAILIKAADSLNLDLILYIAIDLNRPQIQQFVKTYPFSDWLSEKIKARAAAQVSLVTQLTTMVYNTSSSLAKFVMRT